ncbi:hypothetical protein SAMN04488066_101374 [Halorubrum aquaticum]|uniref:Uncharacterized protein n=1 Tax=Halorubrum aquaticum TaxID=387340 RepID=A0A1I2ZBQ7_9EURY|nr:hypothetical protein [Halorubrum aquaticum]SFH34531.1 hypothetical protein SAMN04488066_101374 [Halorubrum aquaticum]
MTRLARTLLGEVGFERAAVWSVTGFALTLVAVRSAGSVGTDPVAVAAACAVVAAVGVAGFARVGGGLLPSALLAYGPVAAVLLELVGPRIRLVAGGGIAVDVGGDAPIPGATGDALATLLAVMEPLALAVAGTVVLALVGFLVGRGLTAATGGDAGNDDANSKDDDGSPTADVDD